MDSGRTPQGIGRGDSRDQSADFGVDRRAAHGGRRESVVQWSRKRRRCHRSTVAGVTMTRARLHPAHTQDSPTQKNLFPSTLLRPGHGPLVHGELMAQREVFEGELAMAAAEEGQRAAGGAGG